MHTTNPSRKPCHEPMDPKTRAAAEAVLAQITNRFGTEGLNALRQTQHTPEHATPWQSATASHIRETLEGDRFWLPAALALWQDVATGPAMPQARTPPVPEEKDLAGRGLSDGPPSPGSA